MKRKPSISKFFRSIYALFDLAAFSVMISIPLILIVRVQRKPAFCFLIVSAVFLIGVFVYLNKSSKRKRDELQRTAVEMALERILLMSDGEIGEAIGCDSFYLIRRQNPDSFDVLEAIRSGAYCIGAVNPTKAALECMERNAPDRKLIASDDLIRMMFPNTDCRAKQRTGFSFFKNRIGKYAVLGIVLFLCSFVVHFKIYYRLISSVCLIIASVSGFFRIPDREK